MQECTKREHKHERQRNSKQIRPVEYMLELASASCLLLRVAEA